MGRRIIKNRNFNGPALSNFLLTLPNLSQMARTGAGGLLKISILMDLHLMENNKMLSFVKIQF